MTAIASFGKRALAWIVLIGLALLMLKFIIGVVIGTLVTAVIVLAVVAGLIWAFRHL